MQRSLFGIGLATLLALGMVQQRVGLISLGYRVEHLRHQRDDLLDQHRVLQYNVLTLQSPVILYRRLAKRQVELAPPKAVEVMTPQPPMSLNPTTPQGPKRLRTPIHWFEQALGLAVRWMEGIRPAEAEPALEKQ